MQKSNWKECKLGDVVDIIMGTSPKGCDINEIGKGMPFFQGSAEFSYRYPIVKKYTTKPVRQAKRGDILFSVRAPIADINIAPTDCAIGRGVAAIRSKAPDLQRYIEFVLKGTRNEWEYLNSSGSVFGCAKKEDLLNFEIPWNDEIDVLLTISRILGSLDDKIELLQKQNKTLEDMAKALFKSWFVDFDVVRAKQKGLPKADIMREYHLTEELYDLFPSSFADSPLGPIPSGWEVKTIQDLGEVVCGKTPSTSHKEYYGGSMPFITIPDMHNSIFANKTERYLTSQGEQAQPTKTLPPFSVCVSCIATPGLVTMTTTNSQTNQQINSVIPHNLETKFYNYYVLRSVADQIRAQGSGGSVFVNLNKTAFSKIKVLWADQSLQKLFTKESESYFNKILNNLKQIQTLTELRNTLLPRLISGKIRV